MTAALLDTPATPVGVPEAGCGLSDRKEYYYLQEAVTAPGVVVDLNTLKLSIRVTKLGIIFLPLKS